MNPQAFHVNLVLLQIVCLKHNLASMLKPSLLRSITNCRGQHLRVNNESLTQCISELHLLESGISGLHADAGIKMLNGFELHLLESGISGFPLAACTRMIFRFELHLLESGISGNDAVRALQLLKNV